jgi:hypothetical protein
MDLIYENIWKALGYLFVSGLVYFAWDEAYKLGKSKGWKKALLKGLGLCFGIAIFAALILGNPSCEETSDPVYGGCESYADDGYEASYEQRLAQFAYYMVLFYVPVVLGAYKAKKEASHGE